MNTLYEFYLKKIISSSKSENVKIFSEKYFKHFKFGKNIASEFSLLIDSLKNGKKISGILNFGFSSFFHYLEFLKSEDPNYIFSDKFKHITLNNSVRNYIFKLLRQSSNKIDVLSDGMTTTVEQMKIKDIIFIWERFNSGTLNDNMLFFQNLNNNEEQYLEILREIFWSKFPSNRVCLDMNSSNVNTPALELSFQEDENANFIPYKFCDDISEKIKKILEKGYSHSILFGGPPGTGKSNLMKGIAANLGKKSIRMTKTVDLSTIYECVKIFRPNVILLEDIDRYSYEISAALNNFESLYNNKNTILLATANRLKILDDALIRPERFSEIIEVRNLDPDVLFSLVENDKEIFEICKNLPVASTKEIIKRIKTFGKEYALKNIDDVLIRAKKANNNDIYMLNGSNIKIDNDPKFLVKNPIN